ncbi:MAG: MgtC/SapB family protein [Thiogranum sp.]|nr:MgtC/SapB family protein [Thiogranum sp.]
MTDDQQTFYYLFVSLAIGLLIGVERGWKERGLGEGERVAGVRTYGLIGLLGGGSALLAGYLGPLALGLAFIGVAGVLTAVYVANLRRDQDVGITSLVAGLLTFVFGALAATGELAVAAAFAVMTTLVLGYKPQLHRWVGALEGDELHAGLKLLLISVVLLPILPNRGFGPWQALNPYQIWWLVVLIAAISFVGYFAIKIGGASKGVVFTGLFGGLASSTAVTLHFSRMGGRSAAMRPILAIGILLACGTMFPRMLLLAGVLNRQLLQLLLAPAAVMTLLIYATVLFYHWSMTHKRVDAEAPLKNPLELAAAMKFGLLLALIMLLGKTLQTWFGDAGVLALAAASGVADVDAITLSLARMSQDELALQVAGFGIIIAAAVNSLVKATMAAVIGGRVIGLRVGLPLLVAAVSGLLIAWLMI